MASCQFVSFPAGCSILIAGAGKDRVLPVLSFYRQNCLLQSLFLFFRLLSSGLYPPLPTKNRLKILIKCLLFKEK